MKQTLRRVNICATALSLLAVLSICHRSSECNAQTREPLLQEWYDSLKQYKRDLGTELNRLPRVANQCNLVGSEPQSVSQTGLLRVWRSGCRGSVVLSENP